MSCHLFRYDYKGIYKLKPIHDFVHPHTAMYKKRCLWLSVCQTYEWEPILDEEHGALYYRNNASGGSSPAAILLVICSTSPIPHTHTLPFLYG